MVDVVKDPHTSSLINLEDKQVLMSSDVVHFVVELFSRVMPGSLSCISTQL